VIPDFREPDILRLGMPPLTTRFRDVREALSRTARVVAAGQQLGYDRTRLRVT
jgi:kynureninase